MAPHLVDAVNAGAGPQTFSGLLHLSKRGGKVPGWLQYLTNDLTRTLFQITFNNPGIFKRTTNATAVTHFAVSPPLHNPSLGPHVLMVPVQIGTAPSGPSLPGYDWTRNAPRLIDEAGTIVLVEKPVPRQNAVVIARFSELQSGLRRSRGGMFRSP